MNNPQHQIKSHWYYVFWGAMAVAVVGGQIYVGLGYREMAQASKDTLISVTCIPKYPHISDTMNKSREFE